MAYRQLIGWNEAAQTCKDEGKAYFSLDYDSGAVYNATCVGGEIIVDRFRGWAESYYFSIYVGGQKVCESIEINDQNETTHELTTYIDTNYGFYPERILQQSGDFEVRVYSNNDTTGDVCSFRTNCSFYINAWYESAVVIEPNGAPTAVSVSPTSTSGATTTLSWSGATAGDNNSISGYDIYYTNSSDGITWDGTWEYGGFESTSTSGSVSVNVHPTVGYYRKYRLVTRSPHGQDYYSESYSPWSNAVLKTNATTACIAPTALSVNSTLAEGNVTLSWSGAKAGTANSISSYLIQYRDSTDNATWGSWTTLQTVTSTSSSGTLSVAPPSTRGNYRQFRIRTQGSAGSSYYSGYKTSTNTVRKNSLPTAPIISAPVAGSSTFNKTPRVLITAGIESDGAKMNPRIVNAGGTSSTSNFSSTGLSNSGKTVYKHPSNISAGAKTIKVDLQDAGFTSAYSTATEVAFNIETLSITDFPVVANTTRVKATHMTELQDAINKVRQYYGLNTYAFTAITSKTTKIKDWATHVTQMRTAINEIITYINNYDSANTINNVSVTWETMTTNPSAIIINQIYNVLQTL